jgi:4-amino-4-deoxy-L-arabinose transferase-like glycosyltransferase
MSKDTIGLKPSKKTNIETPTPLGGNRLRTWFLKLLSFIASTWEVYLILLAAGFLRFYQINTTELDEDQAKLYRMAYDAVHHTLLPVTSNVASIGITNPPGVIYLFMPLAALSSNPMWGAVLVGVFTTAAAVLTYFFTRRYYGRFAGVVAALLYATAAGPLNYARFIWQPNLMPPFVVLFMFALFRGVVDRRKGWFWLALVLFGVLYQMHPTTLLLGVPLLVAIALAPGTFRWRDLLLACFLLLIIFLPYLAWEVFTGFADIQGIFTLTNQHAHFDTQAIHFYRYFLTPYDNLPDNMHSIVRAFAPLLPWLSIAVLLLTLGGFVAAGVLFLLSGEGQSQTSMVGGSDNVVQKACVTIMGWWKSLQAAPYRCGLLLLLVWQIVPLLMLSRHAVSLHSQYFFMFMPGPFILIGILLDKAVAYIRAYGGKWTSSRYAMYALACLVVVAQLAVSTAGVIDTSSGYFDDRSFQPYPYHNDLHSMQYALSEADQLAQQRHLSRIYITTDSATQTALRYLAERMKTPTTLFNAANCLVLPNPAYGPAVLLVGPYDGLTNALLSQFASAALIDSPMRLGGAPYRLYIVTSTTVQTSSSNEFKGDLRLLDTRIPEINYDGSSWLVTRWSLLRPERPSYRTTYSYAITAILGGAGQQSRGNVCTFTAIQSGDQLLVAFSLPRGSRIPTSVIIKAQSFMTLPDNPYYGPFHLETDGDQSTAAIRLHTVGGSDSIMFPQPTSSNH